MAVNDLRSAQALLRIVGTAPRTKVRADQLLLTVIGVGDKVRASQAVVKALGNSGKVRSSQALVKVIKRTPTEEISTITMLMENPDLVAQDDSEIVEYRYPDVSTAVRGIKVKAVTGEIQRQWEFIFEGGATANVSNEIINPDVVFDQLDALKDQELILPLTEFTQTDRSGSEEASVKIVAVERMKTEQGNLAFRVVVQEV